MNPENRLSEEAKNELDKVKEIEKAADTEFLNKNHFRQRYL